MECFRQCHLTSPGGQTFLPIVRRPSPTSLNLTQALAPTLLLPLLRLYLLLISCPFLFIDPHSGSYPAATQNPNLTPKPLFPTDLCLAVPSHIHLLAWASKHNVFSTQLYSSNDPSRLHDPRYSFFSAEVGATVLFLLFLPFRLFFI